MGRVVKGSQLRGERYQLEVPEIAVPVVPMVPTIAGDLHAGTDFGFGEDLDAFAAFDGAELDAPAAPAEPAVDVEGLRAQARALLEDAARSAETVLADAHARARSLIEDASARAESVSENARRRGHSDGFDAGRDEADREMNDMRVTMRGLLEMARVERHKLIQSAEPDLVKLAFGIAERVLHQQVALDRGVVIEMAKNAIARLIERDTVTVRVHPADIERMREHRDELIAIGDIRNLRVVEDQRVGRGGVVVDTDAGTIDARIATQMDEARKVLHIDDDVTVEPAPADLVAKTPLTAARAS